MTCSVLLALGMALAAPGLPSWQFDDDAVLKTWAPNGHLADVAVREGAVYAKAVDWDPFFTCRTVEFEASPWYYVLIRVRADRSGRAELFWSGSLEGKYGGLSEKKTTGFHIQGGNEWHNVAVFPFWQGEGTIRQMRLDLYSGAVFEIASIGIERWGGDAPAATDTYSWAFPEGSTGDWQAPPGAGILLAPPLRLPLGDFGFVAVALSAEEDTEGKVVWASDSAVGTHEESFAIRGDGRVRHYNAEVQSHPAWEGNLVALGLRLPEEAGIQLKSVTLSPDPTGPPDLHVTYFGFEDGVNRAGSAASVLLQVENRGGKAETPARVTFARGAGLEGVPEEAQELAIPGFAERSEARFAVQAANAGDYTVRVAGALGEDAVLQAEAGLRFLSPLGLPEAAYVPEPHPVETNLDICAYYFPGWVTDVKWDCVRGTAPIRKPLLGYYDESKIECVDWQIKWAVENGIGCFLVDWYWNQGSEHLKHWFEAYRKARYRDQLEVAIMWANHLPPGSHTREDWINVTREWIEQYFTLPRYYHIDGKPAVFLWDPRNIRRDLGGSEAVKDAFGASQGMAREAGFAGIEFVGLHDFRTKAQAATLVEEGYTGATTYHEWGRAADTAPAPKRYRFEDVVTTAAERWAEYDALCGEALQYYPVIDSGWDSRPWHGGSSLVIGGRTVEGFERLLGNAKQYAEKEGHETLLIGPLNEWGEGSYIEPCTEFGFGMYEAVRRVFARGSEASWPVNVGPRDLGLGPYDFPPKSKVTSWDFAVDCGGWSGMMGVGSLRCTEGLLTCQSVTHDPALHARLENVHARDYPRAFVRMRLTAEPAVDTGAQLFWSMGGGATTESTSVRLPVRTDGTFHDYTFELHENPRWRGRISSLRFDPCAVRGVEVAIEAFRLVPAEEGSP